MYRNTYVEIDTDIIKENAKNILEKYNNYKYYIAVVKGNAYGHGAYIVNTLEEAGFNYFAVSSLEEALEVRNYTKKDIMCLEPIDLKYMNICIKNNIAITVNNIDYFNKLMKLGLKRLKVHIKLNTGLNRLGFKTNREVEKVYNALIDNKDIKLVGIYSHFATTGITDIYYDKQVSKFRELTKNIDLSKIPMVHFDKSSSLEYHPKLDFTNTIRVGGMIYGIKQPAINYRGLKGILRKIKHDYIINRDHISETIKRNDLKIRYALKLKSEVIDIQKIEPGDIVGYGGHFKAEKNGYIAVLPIGYADGLDLKYTNCNVKIRGNMYPIVGIVNMGMIMILVDDKVKLGDIATIIDNNMKEIAKNISATPYMVMTMINKSVPRIYLEKGKVIKVTE